MVKHYDQTLWSNIVCKHYGQTLFANIMVKHCLQTLWSNIVCKHYGQTLFANIIVKHCVQTKNTKQNGAVSIDKYKFFFSITITFDKLVYKHCSWTKCLTVYTGTYACVQMHNSISLCMDCHISWFVIRLG